MCEQFLSLSAGAGRCVQALELGYSEPPSTGFVMIFRLCDRWYD